MNLLEDLRQLSGRWLGVNRLQDPNTGSPDTSPATAVVTPVLGGRFVRFDYTWAYRGDPQEGSILIGHDAGSGAFTASWIDTWHLGGAIMACRGEPALGPVITVRGSYPAPPGPDWGWRHTLEARGADTFRIIMHNITPEGVEEPAVEAEYRRA